MGGILFIGLGGGVGGSGSSLAIPDKHVFTGSNKAQAESARDSYFTQNPTEKVKDVYALVKPTDGTGPFLQKWDGAAWIDEAKVIQGPAGLSGSTPVVGPNGNWFIDGKDTGTKAGGQDLTGFKDGEVLVVDKSTGNLVGSDVFASDGSLTVAPGSIQIGEHVWSSSAENITAKNLNTGKVYTPLWQEVAPDQKAAFIREHNGIKDVIRSSADSDDITNPTIDITVTKDETAFGITVDLVAPVTKLVMSVLFGGKTLYTSKWPTAEAGKKLLTLDSPSDFKAGNTYTVKFTSEDGDVVMKGESSTGVPYYVSHISEWNEKQIATRDWVNSLPSSTLSNPVTHVSLIGSDKLQMTHADGTKNMLALPNQGGSAPDLTPIKDDIALLEKSLTDQGNDIAALKSEYGNIEHSLNDIRSTYVYTGSGFPDYPDDVQGRYFITLKGQAARDIDVDMPDHDSADIKNGTMYFLENDNAQAVVNLSTPMGQTIDGKQTLTIESNHHVLLFKNGANWVVAMNKSNATVAAQISANDIRNALDRGEYTSGSLKTMGYGWWSVKATNKNVTGKPRDSQGDLIVMHQKVSGNAGKPNFGVMLAFGQDTNGDSAQWAQYRDGTKWTPWFKVVDINSAGTHVDIAAINKAIADGATRVAAMENDVSGLKTQIGDIYAPSKTVFDTAVNALIDAKLAAITPSHGGGGDKPAITLPKIYAMFSNNVPTTLAVDGAVTSTNGKATLTRIPTTRSRVFVLVENDNDEASKVTGISVDGGLSSAWQPRDIVIDGKKYRAFYSAGAYTEKTLRIKVNFE